MYGLVNQAIEGLFVSSYGTDVWENLKKESKIKVDSFISMNNYPDEVSYKILETASKSLSISIEELLIKLGKYWILYTAKTGYGNLLDLSGKTFSEFLQNVDNLHTKVAMIMPELKPPSFQCFNITENSLYLQYYSERIGLTPMVKGILAGLAEMFKIENIKIKQTKVKDKEVNYDEFYIEWKG